MDYDMEKGAKRSKRTLVYGISSPLKSTLIFVYHKDIVHLHSEKQLWTSRSSLVNITAFWAPISTMSNVTVLGVLAEFSNHMIGV